MSKLSSITENKYTLRDIFVRNHEVWLAIPLFCYLLTPVVHMIVFALNYAESTDDEAQMARTLATGEWIGDYYTPIIMVFTVFAAFITVVAMISNLIFKKQIGLNKSIDSLPVAFFVVVCLLIIISTIINHTESVMIFGLSGRGEGVAIIICYFLVYYLQAY